MRDAVSINKIENDNRKHLYTGVNLWPPHTHAQANVLTHIHSYNTLAQSRI